MFLCFRFIEKYGTHIVAGVTMGGKDVIYMKQLRNSTHDPDQVQQQLKQLCNKRFSPQSISPAAGNYPKVNSLKKLSLSICILSVQKLKRFDGYIGGESYPVRVAFTVWFLS